MYGEVPSALASPNDEWTHYIMAAENHLEDIYKNGILINQPGVTGGSPPAGYDDLLLFATQVNFNDSKYSPDIAISNLKIFYTKFNAAEALQLYNEEIGSK